MTFKQTMKLEIARRAEIKYDEHYAEYMNLGMPEEAARDLAQMEAKSFYENWVATL